MTKTVDPGRARWNGLKPSRKRPSPPQAPPAFFVERSTTSERAERSIELGSTGRTERLRGPGQGSERNSSEPGHGVGRLGGGARGSGRNVDETARVRAVPAGCQYVRVGFGPPQDAWLAR